MAAVRNGYQPDYVVPPGETLLEMLGEESMSQAELARRTGLSTKHISQIANGHVPISTDVAIRLERATGVPARLMPLTRSRAPTVPLRTPLAGLPRRRERADGNPPADHPGSSC